MDLFERANDLPFEWAMAQPSKQSPEKRITFRQRPPRPKSLNEGRRRGWSSLNDFRPCLRTEERLHPNEGAEEGVRITRGGAITKRCGVIVARWG